MQGVQLRRSLRWIMSNTKRLVALLVGTTIVGAGLAMLALPGPGIVVILLGLAVLATEFVWAERVLDRAKSKASGAVGAAANSRSARALLLLSGGSLMVGGAMALAFAGPHREYGIGALIAGACAIAVLLPVIQRWLEQPSASAAASRPAPSPDPSPSPSTSEGRSP